MAYLLKLTQWGLSAILFMLLFLSIRYAGLALYRKSIRAAGMPPKLDRELSVTAGGHKQALFRHLMELMEATRMIRTMGRFVFLTVWMLLVGMVTGIGIFRSYKGLMVCMIIFGLMPYLFLRVKLISSRHRTRLDFLPAVEVFYQQFVIDEGRNLRLTLQKVVTGDRLQYPIKSSFEQLQRNMTAGRDQEMAFRIFSLELGHIWADYFVHILRMGLTEGVPITTNLKELVYDMRRAQLFDQRARNRLLEIRLASFSPAFFMLLFLGINLKLDYHQAYYYYFVDPAGLNLILNGLLLVFGAFLMGLYLSMRRM